MTPIDRHNVVRFGEYEANFGTGELRKNNVAVRLQEKPLRVLAALLEQPGEIVSREELHKRLWPDATFVDFEVGLNTAVKKLRGALVDVPEKPQYIETIPRRGYRFIAALRLVPENGGDGQHLETEVCSSGLTDSTAHSQPASKGREANSNAGNFGSETEAVLVRPRQRFSPLSWLTATLVLFLIASLWWLTPLPAPHIENVYPVTTDGRQDFLVRPATDGVRLFYVQRAGDHYDLMQALGNGGDVQKMEEPFRNTLIWDVSPDGSQYLITSFARRGEPSQLWSWPVTGGPPVKLDSMVSGSATYSPNGKMIAYHIGKELWLGNLDGSKRKIGTFGEDVDDPAWSPDGRRLRFTLKDADHDTMSIWEIGVDGKGLRPILPHWSDPSRICCGSWTPDGRYFIFVESASPSRLWALREKSHWLRRSPTGPFLLVSQADGSWSPLVGRDGAHLYFYSNSFQDDLETLDVASHQFSAFLAVARPVMPAFSRDGRWVAYIRSTTGALWRSRVDGGDARELPFPNMKVAFPRWSPDGKMLAFTAQRAGSLPNVYAIDAEGGAPQMLVSGHENIHDPDWSADGLRLVVTEEISAGGGRTAGTRLAFINRPSRQLHEIPGSDGLWMPRWSPDGRSIVALTQDQREIQLYDLEGNRWRTLARGKVLGMPVWSLDSADVYYQDSAEPGEPLARVNVVSRRSESVASFQGMIDSGITKCVFIALDNGGHPMIGFNRRDSDIYGARLVAP